MNWSYVGGIEFGVRYLCTLLHVAFFDGRFYWLFMFFSFFLFAHTPIIIIIITIIWQGSSFFLHDNSGREELGFSLFHCVNLRQEARRWNDIFGKNKHVLIEAAFCLVSFGSHFSESQKRSGREVILIRVNTLLTATILFLLAFFSLILSSFLVLLVKKKGQKRLSIGRLDPSKKRNLSCILVRFEKEKERIGTKRLAIWC